MEAANSLEKLVQEIYVDGVSTLDETLGEINDRLPDRNLTVHELKRVIKKMGVARWIKADPEHGSNLPDFIQILKAKGDFENYTSRWRAIEETGVRQQEAKRRAAYEFGWAGPTGKGLGPQLDENYVWQEDEIADKLAVAEKQEEDEQDAWAEARSEHEAALKRLAEDASAESPDVKRDVLWAYRNLARDPDPSEAPSVGALAMLDYAKIERKDFMSKVIQYGMKKEDVGENAAKRDKGLRVNMDRARDLLEKHGIDPDAAP